MGRKKRPFFRIVAIDERRARDGKPLEDLGFLNPLRSEEEFRFRRAPTLRWYFKGARASDPAYSLMKRAGIVEYIRLIKTNKMTLDEAIAKAEEQDKLDHETVVSKAAKEHDASLSTFSPSVSPAVEAEAKEPEAKQEESAADSTPAAAAPEATTAPEAEAEAEAEADVNTEPAAEKSEDAGNADQADTEAKTEEQPSSHSVDEGSEDAESAESAESSKDKDSVDKA